MGNTPPTSSKAKPTGTSSSSPGEAWSLESPLPEVIEAMIYDYHAGDFDVSGYSLEDCKSFTLFRVNAVPTFYAFDIATHALHGRRTEAVELARNHPKSLLCITQARDPFGRLAEGTPVDLAAAAGNRRLTEELMKLVPEKLQSEAKRHLARRFHPGWEEETQDRMKQCYLDPLTHFTDQLEAKKLSKDVTFEQAMFERKAMIGEFRGAIRSKPDDAPITTGLIFDPQVYPDIDQLFFARQDRLGGWCSPESALFWGVGYQSLLGAGSAVIAHVVISGANEYFDHHREPAEVVIFKDNTPYFLANPASGIGVDFVVSFCGDKCLTRDGEADLPYGAAGWRCGLACWWLGMGGVWGSRRLWESNLIMSSKNINIAELMLPQDNPLTIRMEL